MGDGDAPGAARTDSVPSMEREIVVRGTGEARALPDLASLRVEVTADRKSQDEAYDARADIAAKVDVVFSQHASAIARTTVASLWVQPRTRWHRGEDIRTGWRASRTTFVDVVVLDALGVIMSDGVAAGAVGHGAELVDGVDQHRLRPGPPGRRRGRPPPGHRLLRGPGPALGDVAWVAEPGMRSGTPPSAPRPRGCCAPATRPAGPRRPSRSRT